MEEITATERSERVFSRAIRGYQPTEVDAYIDRMTENYDALYRENIELTRRLAELQEQLNAARETENDIVETLKKAKRAEDAIVRDAYQRADAILSHVKADCAAVLNDFRARIESEKATLAKLRESTRTFKADLYDAYRAHIEMIEQTVPDVEPEEELSADEYAAGIVKDLKNEVAARYDVPPEAVSESEGTAPGNADDLQTQRETLLLHPEIANELSAKDDKKKENAPSVIELLNNEE